MAALGDAFAAIEDGAANDYVMADDFREYQFDGFSIIVDAANPVFYECEDSSTIAASFAGGDPPTVRLRRGGAPIFTQQVAAASGAKFESDLGVMFWTKGDEAMVEWPQGTRFNCRVRQ